MSSDKQESAIEQRVRVIKPHQFDANTTQTPGMQRVAAVSKQLARSQGLWAGITVVAPNVASGIHHHGETETVIYVILSFTSRIQIASWAIERGLIWQGCMRKHGSGLGEEMLSYAFFL